MTEFFKLKIAHIFGLSLLDKKWSIFWFVFEAENYE
jgi:hypothetical protein